MKNVKTALLIAGLIGIGLLLLWQGPVPARSGPSPSVENSISGTPGDVAVPLIASGRPADIEWPGRTPAARRVRRIFPDTSWMTPEPGLAPGDRIQLALFDDAVFEAEVRNVTRHANGSVGITAHLVGARGAMYLSYSDGVLRASVEPEGGTGYAVRYLPETGAHYALEVDLANSVILEGADPRVLDAAVAGAELASGSQASAEAVAGAPSGSTIVDVMVVYTPAALAYEGSVSNMNNNIAMAMQKANEAHTNSDTRVYLNLVHSAEIDYAEIDANTDLDNLTYSGGTFKAMDEVHDLRDLYAADLVCLYEMTDEVGGLGWLLNSSAGRPAYAFCLARVQQSDWTYTVVHEWGHNMGCGHSKTQALSKGPGLYGYSAGWQWDDEAAKAADGFCSIMTYENFDGLDNGYEYERVPYFSNPEIDYVGSGTNATGHVQDGDSARTIREVRAVLAAYRKAPDVDYDGLPNEWELQYFGSETDADPEATASNGINTLLEAYIAGLDPTDAQASFRATSSGLTADGFVVRWNPVSGRIYSVNWSSGLGNGFQPLAANMVWPQSAYTDTVHGVETKGFYRIEVQLAE